MRWCTQDLTGEGKPAVVEWPGLALRAGVLFSDGVRVDLLLGVLDSPGGGVGVPVPVSGSVSW